MIVLYTHVFNKTHILFLLRPSIRDFVDDLVVMGFGWT